MNATRKLKNDHIMIRRVKDMIKHTPKLYTNQYINRGYSFYVMF